MVLFNGLPTLFTLGLVFLGWWQMRAYIQATPQIISHFSLSPLVAPISIIDAGSTPAYQVDAKVWCAVAPNWTERDLRKYEQRHPAPAHSNTTIFPHSPQFAEICSGKLTPEQVTEITTNEEQLFLFGTIGYRTLKFWSRHSNFCFHLSGED